MDPVSIALMTSAAANLAGTVGGFLGGGGGRNTDWLDQQMYIMAKENQNWSNTKDSSWMQIRKADAEAAGFHPLAALGVAPSGTPPMPMFLGGSEKGPSIGSRLESAAGHFGALGQNLQRAMMAQATQQEREIHKATLDKMAAETDMVRAQTAESLKRTANIGMNPPVPIPSKYQLVRRPDGSLEAVYSSEMSQAIMSDPLKMWASSLENAFAGPMTLPFWRQVGDSTKRLLHPLQTLRNSRMFDRRRR